MQRLQAFFLFFTALLSLRAASPLLTLDNEQLPSPAGVGASAPHFGETPNGRVVLVWTAPDSDNNRVRHSAEYDPKARSWNTPDIDRPVGGLPQNAQPDAGPVTVSRAGRMARAWFVADKKDPHVLVSVDAGEQFLMPVRVDDSRPAGAPDLVLLADGTVFVSWPEHYNTGEIALWLRRISPGGSLSVPVLLATTPAGQPSPKLALVKDFDDKPAQLMLAYTVGEPEAAQLITRLLTIAPASATVRTGPCNCPDDDDAVRGHALRGRIVSFSAGRGILVVQHGQIGGVLPAATTVFKVDPAVLKQASVGNEFFARVERRDDAWWLFDLRLIVRAETTSTVRP